MRNMLIGRKGRGQGMLEYLIIAAVVIAAALLIFRFLGKSKAAQAKTMTDSETQGLKDTDDDVNDALGTQD